MTQRLDQRLVTLGFAASRSRAQAMIKAGAVTLDGAVHFKAASVVAENADVQLIADPLPWVSRAALKLAHALDAYDLSPRGAVALDCGASTGGFTEVLLDRGARRVYAVDVGRDQLAPKLREDPRVINLQGLNLKDLSARHIPEPADWITADLSFISLSKALPAALARAADDATLIALIKPQFEVGPEHVGKGGVVKDPRMRETATAQVRAWLEASGWDTRDPVESPITGADGNVEHLIAAARRGAGFAPRQRAHHHG